jgi:hypothetical protein
MCRGIPLLPLSAFVACFRVNFTFVNSFGTKQHKQQAILATHLPSTWQIFFRFRPLHLPSRLFQRHFPLYFFKHYSSHSKPPQPHHPSLKSLVFQYPKSITSNIIWIFLSNITNCVLTTFFPGVNICLRKL